MEVGAGLRLYFVQTKVIVLVLWLTIVVVSVVADMPTYYIDDYCSNTLDMSLARVTSGRLMLRRPGDGLVFENCFMFIKAPANRRLVLKFHTFDVKSPYGCDKDSIQLYDDFAFQRPLTDRQCNSGRLPNKAYLTSSEEATIYLRKQQYLGDQIELIFTAFHYAPCIGNEFECKNGHCIDGDLYCNGYDNCGDASDYCFLRTGTVIGIIIAVVVVVVVVAIIAALLLYNRQRKIRREREKQILDDLALEVSHTSRSHLADWDHTGARTLSDLSSLRSSTSSLSNHHHHHHHHTLTGSHPELHKIHDPNHPHHHHSLLSKRDSQLRRGAGLTGDQVSVGAKTELHHHPYDAEMATKVTYVLPGGQGSSPTSRVSTVDRSRHSPALKRSRSLNTETQPFYFNKEDYYSDGGNNADYRTVDKKIASSEKPMTGTASKPKHASPHDEVDVSKSKKKKVKKSKKKKSKRMDHKFDDGYESPPIDYDDFDPIDSGTVDRASAANRRGLSSHVNLAGTNENSVPLHINTPHGPMSPTVYLTPAVEGITAFPHVPSQASPAHTVSSNNMTPAQGNSYSPASGANMAKMGFNQTVVGVGEEQNVVIETSPAGDEISPRNLSALSGGNTPEGNRTGLSERRPSATPLVLQTVNPRQGVTSGGVKLPTPRPNQYSSLPHYGKGHYTGTPRSQTIETNDMIQQNAMKTGIQNGIGGTSQLNRASPTRRSALSARHADGSPFLLHAVDTGKVKQELREHPEHGADVLDHVISFRCYDSPMPREELKLFRQSTRRSGRHRRSRHTSR